eukprot:TRINITY_DN1754_c0_g1_i10.p1 TRINITY_DN1754_c0_g1~~TRINITY_DN1754_c0_g1_i10.p1  ORF type:complete len:1262 (+),score=148.62 TRINITY_DN1754_c0_g1_i10:58-3786(+)
MGGLTPLIHKSGNQPLGHSVNQVMSKTSKRISRGIKGLSRLMKGTKYHSSTNTLPLVLSASTHSSTRDINGSGDGKQPDYIMHSRSMIDLGRYKDGQGKSSTTGSLEGSERTTSFTKQQASQRQVEEGAQNLPDENGVVKPLDRKHRRSMSDSGGKKILDEIGDITEVEQNGSQQPGNQLNVQKVKKAIHYDRQGSSSSHPSTSTYPSTSSEHPQLMPLSPEKVNSNSSSNIPMIAAPPYPKVQAIPSAPSEYPPSGPVTPRKTSIDNADTTWVMEPRLKSSFKNKKFMYSLMLATVGAALVYYDQLGYTRSYYNLSVAAASVLAMQGRVQVALQLLMQSMQSLSSLETYSPVVARVIGYILLCLEKLSPTEICKWCIQLLSMGDNMFDVKREDIQDMLQTTAKENPSLSEQPLPFDELFQIRPMKGQCTRFYGETEERALRLLFREDKKSSAKNAVLGDMVEICVSVYSQLPEKALVHNVKLVLCQLLWCEDAQHHEKEHPTSEAQHVMSDVQSDKPSSAMFSPRALSDKSQPNHTIEMEQSLLISQKSALNNKSFRFDGISGIGGDLDDNLIEQQGETFERSESVVFQCAQSSVEIVPGENILKFQGCPVLPGMYIISKVQATLDNLPLEMREKSLADQAPNQSYTSIKDMATDYNYTPSIRRLGIVQINGEVSHENIVMNVSDFRQRLSVEAFCLNGSLIQGQWQWLGLVLTSQRERVSGLKVSLLKRSGANLLSEIIGSKQPRRFLERMGSKKNDFIDIVASQNSGPLVEVQIPQTVVVQKLAKQEAISKGEQQQVQEQLVPVKQQQQQFPNLEQQSPNLRTLKQFGQLGRTLTLQDFAQGQQCQPQVAQYPLLGVENEQRIAMNKGTIHVSNDIMSNNAAVIWLWTKVGVPRVEAEMVYVDAPVSPVSACLGIRCGIRGVQQRDAGDDGAEVELHLEYEAGCRRSHLTQLGLSLTAPFKMSIQARSIGGGVDEQCPTLLTCECTSQLGAPIEIINCDLEPQSGLRVLENWSTQSLENRFLPLEIPPCGSVRFQFIVDFDKEKDDVIVDEEQGRTFLVVAYRLLLEKNERPANQVDHYSSISSSSNDFSLSLPNPDGTEGLGVQGCQFRHAFILDDSSQRRRESPTVHLQFLGPFEGHVGNAMSLSWQLVRHGNLPRQSDRRTEEMIQYDLVVQECQWLPRRRLHGTVRLGHAQGSQASIEAQYTPCTLGPINPPELHLRGVNLTGGEALQNTLIYIS